MSSGPGGAYGWGHHATWTVPGPTASSTTHPPQPARPAQQATPPQQQQHASYQQPPSSTETSASDAGSMAKMRSIQPNEHTRPASSDADHELSQLDGLPEAPTEFPELESMELSELRVMLEEPARFDNFVSNHWHTRQVDDVLTRTRNQKVEVEEKLRTTQQMVTSEETVDEEKVQGMEAQVASLRDEVEVLQAAQDEWFRLNSPERLMERLRVGMRESETTSEAMEKSMLSSMMNFDEFLSKYIDCRKKFHERSLKLARLKWESENGIELDR